MTPIAWLLLLAVLLLDTAAHLLLKAASIRAERASHGEFLRALPADPLFWLAILCFSVLLVTWIGFISLVPLSQGVMAGSITIAGVMVGGRLFFNEAITPPRALASVLISIGVLLVGWDAA